MKDPSLKTVLIIEDNATDAKLIKEYLLKMKNSINIILYDKLKDAISYLNKHSVDVILLDLSLPDSEGLKTFFTVQSSFPFIPILILTALDDSKVADEAVRAGAQDYLVKGKFNNDLFVKAIRYAVERKVVDMGLQGL